MSRGGEMLAHTVGIDQKHKQEALAMLEICLAETQVACGRVVASVRLDTADEVLLAVRSHLIQSVALLQSSIVRKRERL